MAPRSTARCSQEAPRGTHEVPTMLNNCLCVKLLLASMSKRENDYRIYVDLHILVNQYFHDFFELKNGSKVKLPFSQKEYNTRLLKLREVMSINNLDVIVLTSMLFNSSNNSFVIKIWSR